MILGIASLGEGRRPIEQRAQLWIAHSLGGVLGGTLMALTVWIVVTPIRTLLPRSVTFLLFALVATYGILADLGRTRFHRPKSQVPATWYARYGPAKSYLLYGLSLGAGMLTYVPYGAVYGTFAAIAALLPLPAAAVAGALFGLGRTLPSGPASFVVEPI